MKLKEYKNIELGNLNRSFKIDNSNIDIENRLVKFALSSEEPYQRFFGMEILSHEKSAIDLSRLMNGAPLLAEHDPTKQIGIIESVSLDKDKVLRCVARFSKNPLAQEYFQDIVDGIKTKVSVGYTVTSMIKIGEQKNEKTFETIDIYLVDGWIPHEGSIVSIPADDSVGIGRSHEAVITIAARQVDKDESPQEQPVAAYVQIDSNIVEQVSVADFEAGSVDTKGKKPQPQEDDEEDEDEDDEDRSNKDLENNSNTEANTDKEKFDKGLNTSENNNNPKKIITRNNNNMLENENLAEILAIGAQHKEFELANEFATSGKTAKQLLAAILEKKLSTPSRVDAGVKRELDTFDLNGYLREMVEGSGNMTAFAKELDQDFRGRSKNGGLVLPRSVYQKAQRDYVVGTPSAGGNVAQNQFRPDLIEALYNDSIMLGIVSHYPSATGTSSVTYPVANGRNTFQMVPEKGRATASNATFDHVTFTPHTASGRTEISREMVKQSGVRPIESFVVSTLLASFDEFRDNELLNGTGTDGRILGIFNQTGTNPIALPAGGLDWATVVKMKAEIAYQNAKKGRMAYLTNSRVEGHLQSVQKFANYGTAILEGNTMNGLPVLISNQIEGAAANQEAIALVNGTHTHYIEWDGYEITVNPYRLGAGQVEYEMFATFDFQVSRPQGISMIKNIVL